MKNIISPETYDKFRGLLCSISQSILLSSPIADQLWSHRRLSTFHFHLSGILIFQYILCKGNDYLEKLARFLLKYAARRLALRRNSGSHGTGCRQHADTAPCKPPRNPAVRPSATAASRPAIGGKKTCSRPAATAPEARPAGHRKKREVPPRKRRNLRYVPLPDYSSAPSGSATRIRPQYSQMMIFLP